MVIHDLNRTSLPIRGSKPSDVITLIGCPLCDHVLGVLPDLIDFKAALVDSIGKRVETELFVAKQS